MMNVENTEEETKVKRFEITISDRATYLIESTSEELAKEKALEYFSEREPIIVVEDVTSIPSTVYEDLKQYFIKEE